MQAIEALADHFAAALDRPARDGKSQLPRTSEALDASAAGMGGRRRPAHHPRRRRRRHRRQPCRATRRFGPRHSRRAGPVAAVDHNRRGAGTMEIMLAGRRGRLRHGAGTEKSHRPSRRRSRTRNDALADWRSTTALTVTLSATTGFVVLILGFAFHWQATRAREADLIHDTVRCRIDTALNRGRCGLWDWDLARGRVFWSHSMYDILGLPQKDDLLTFGEVNALVHKDDINLYELATQLADAKVQSIDHAFRMRHADGQWLWLRVRCELARQDGEAGLHLIGIAVDITEQKSLVERTMAADLRLRDAIETIPEAFVLWDADNRLVLVQFEFPGTASSARRRRCRRRAIRGDRGRRAESRSCAPRSPMKTASRPARAPSRPNSTTAAGCISANAAPRTAATSRSAPTSPRSNSTSRNWSKARSVRSRPSPTCANPKKRWSCKPKSLPISRKNTPRKRPAPRMPIRRNRNSSPI